MIDSRSVIPIGFVGNDFSYVLYMKNDCFCFNGI